MFGNSFGQYSDYKEKEAFLKAKKDLFEQYQNGQINKTQYEMGLESLELQREEFLLGKEKVTKGDIAIGLLAGSVKGLANGIFAMSGSSIRFGKKKK